MPKRKPKNVYRAPVGQAARLSLELKTIGARSQRIGVQFVALLAHDGVSAADVRELQRRASVSLSRDAIKKSQPMLERASVDVTAFSFACFSASAKKHGFDLRSALAPKKKDRADAKRKSPGQLGRSLEKQFGVSLDDPWIRSRMNAFAREGAALVSDMTKTQVKRIADATVRAVSNGWTQKELGDAIADIGDMTDREAQGIARNQSYWLNGQMGIAICEEVGLDEFQWITMNDGSVRPTHAALHEEICSISNPPEAGLPGEEDNCRCVLAPVFPAE